MTNEEFAGSLDEREALKGDGFQRNKVLLECEFEAEFRDG